LNAHRSSIEPPPARDDEDVDGRPCALAVAIASAMSAAAPSPWTAAG
jgi:hypothetical protein